MINRVSSVLNRDTTSFGKQHLTDGSEETCWNSEQVSSPVSEIFALQLTASSEGSSAAYSIGFWNTSFCGNDPIYISGRVCRKEMRSAR